MNAKALEWGDFQTPAALCRRVADTLRQLKIAPRTVVEPTCGVGGLLHAALQVFPEATGVGVEIGEEKCHAARRLLQGVGSQHQVEQGDFYAIDWGGRVASWEAPRLFVGNPPWVTSAGLGRAGIERNLPEKSRAGSALRLSGMEARTGLGNFDVSEWMLCRLIRLLSSSGDTLAMLVKSSVARRVLQFAWREEIPGEARLYSFDAQREFGVSVDAVLFVWQYREGFSKSALCFDLDSDEQHPEHVPRRTVGERHGTLVSDVEAYDRYRRLLLPDSEAPPIRWRSGVKHDCAAVFELEPDNGGWRSRNERGLSLEQQWLHPLYKGSALFNGAAVGERWLLLPQRRVGEDTATLAALAPEIWAYLDRHRSRLNSRRSSIYRGRPPFSVFGVGDYSFAPWKIAISALHKSLRFRVVGPHDGHAVLFDDTVYFLPFDDRHAAQRVFQWLQSEPVQTLLCSMIFWDSKRPITAKVLQKLDVRRAHTPESV